MRIAIVLAAVLTMAAAAPPQTGHMTPAPHRAHLLCTLQRCGHCPRGKWDCAGRCIPNNQVCRPF